MTRAMNLPQPIRRTRATILPARRTEHASAGAGEMDPPAPQTPPTPTPLTHLFRSQHSHLLRFAQIRTGNRAIAEDLVQDAFLAVRRAYPDKGAEDLRPLLFTTLRNLTVNYLKSGDYRRQRASTEISDIEYRLTCERSATPETQVMDAQLLALAEEVIAAMAPRRREALRLHRFEGLTYDEIASRLSVSRSTVKSDIADAVAEIAERLAREDRRDPDPAR